jgi:hypothetical protein
MFYRLLLGLAAASLLSAQTGPAGHWEGTFQVETRDIGVSLDLAQNEKAVWIASMGVPGQASGLVVKDLVVKDKTVKFMAVELQMSTVELKLGEDGKLTGTISNARGSLPLALTRKGDAKVELPAPSPAVSKDLEGDWAGTIQTPGSDFQVEVHFKNQPDNTVLATIDIPVQNAMGMPMNDVKEAGEKVTFGLKIAHAEFEGTLNKETHELTGKLGHDAQTMPVALKKK